jgi:hypothetical protein
MSEWHRDKYWLVRVIGTHAGVNLTPGDMSYGYQGSTSD